MAASVLAGPAHASAPNPPSPPREADVIPIVLLVDAGSGQTLLAREAQRRFLPASLTKVMTAYTALELIAAGKVRPEQRLAVRPHTYAAWSGKGSTMLLHSGESVPVDALLQGLAVVSANNAAVVLAEGIAGGVPAWTAMMNDQARRLGFRCSHFATPNGWPDHGATWVCARDLARPAGALVDRHPQAYRRYFGQISFTWNGATGENRNPLLGAVAGADGIKTGHSAEAGYNLLGSAERGGRRLVLVLAGAKTGEQRAAASRALIEWGFSAWHSRKLYEGGDRIGTAHVQGGDARSVGLRTGRAVRFATIRAGEALSGTIAYRGPLPAPVAKGAEVARLRIVSASGQSAQVPLFAAEAVGRAGPVDRIVNAFAAWFA